MNHLAHYLLAPPGDEARMGTLLGDFARGSDLSAWPPAVESAIRLHRRIDRITDSHPAVSAVKRLAPESLRRYAGILTDVFFDHVLIAQWPRWSATPRAAFSAEVYECLRRTAAQMPPDARLLAQRMVRYDILGSCTTREGVAEVLDRIGDRLSHPVALGQGADMLETHLPQIEAAFAQLFPDLQTTAAQWSK